MYISGDPWIICDRCGFKTRKSESRMTWDNYMVCLKDWEPRHPQDYLVKGRADKQFVRDARPRPADVFRETQPDTGLILGEGGNMDFLLLEEEDGFLELQGD